MCSTTWYQGLILVVDYCACGKPISTFVDQVTACLREHFVNVEMFKSFRFVTSGQTDRQTDSVIAKCKSIKQQNYIELH